MHMHSNLIEVGVIDEDVVDLGAEELDRRTPVAQAPFAPERQPVANNDQHLAGLVEDEDLNRPGFAGGRLV